MSFSKVTQSIRLLDYVLRADLGGAGKKCDRYPCPLELCEEILPGSRLASDFAGSGRLGVSGSTQHLPGPGWMGTWLFPSFIRHIQHCSAILNKTGLWPVLVAWAGAVPSVYQTLSPSRALFFMKKCGSFCFSPVTNWFSSEALQGSQRLTSGLSLVCDVTGSGFRDLPPRNMFRHLDYSCKF